MRFTGAELPGGREALRTNPITFEGDATTGEDATKVGAAGTGVVLATRGREVTLGAGANLAASLATPFTVQAPVR